MSFTKPEMDGEYVRKADGRRVLAVGCTGSSGIDSVLVRTIEAPIRHWHVRLENFWRKYKPVPCPCGESRPSLAYDRHRDFPVCPPSAVLQSPAGGEAGDKP